MKKFLIIAISILLVQLSNAQTITPEQYIALYKNVAIQEMQRMGIPAAITLAQGLLETENGNSVLVKYANNHFGIKCKATWTGATYSHDDDAPGECFRVYKDGAESYRDHSNFLRGRPNYAPLFNLDPLDYKAWAYGLKKAGYATNTKYPLILIKNIEQYNLQQYSLEAAKNLPKFDKSKYTDDNLAIMNSDAIADTLADTIKINQPIKIEKNTAIAEKVIAEKNNKIVEQTDVINGSKYVMGKKGSTITAIAFANKITLAKALEYNDLDQDATLNKDQIIFIEKKNKQSNEDFYIVQKGETLADIAQKNGIQLKALINYNPDMLPVGTRLKLRTAKVINMPTTRPTIHEVLPKESLYSIAKLYNVTPQQIRNWNNLTGDDLKIGLQIVVSP